MAQPMMATRQGVDLASHSPQVQTSSRCAYDEPRSATSTDTQHSTTTHVLVPPPPPFSVLVVDDNAINRRMLAFPLTKAGISVIEAADGVEAVQMFALHAPDLILMDITMPNMDGYQASYEIRRLEHLAANEAAAAAGSAEARRRNCRIVATTSLQSEADLQQGQNAGMDDWLVKPIKPVKLVADVKAFQQMLAVEAAIPA